MRTIKLEFQNRDAGPCLSPEKWDCLWVDREGAERVMEWYGSYYAGDDYTVYANGVEIELDINGEWKHETIDATTNGKEE